MIELKNEEQFFELLERAEYDSYAARRIIEEELRKVFQEAMPELYNHLKYSEDLFQVDAELAIEKVYDRTFNHVTALIKGEIEEDQFKLNSGHGFMAYVKTIAPDVARTFRNRLQRREDIEVEDIEVEDRCSSESKNVVDIVEQARRIELVNETLSSLPAMNVFLLIVYYDLHQVNNPEELKRVALASGLSPSQARKIAQRGRKIFKSGRNLSSSYTVLAELADLSEDHCGRIIRGELKSIRSRINDERFPAATKAGGQ